MLPVIDPGAAGAVVPVIAFVLAALVPQLLLAVTLNVPEVNVLVKLTDTEVVPWPLRIVAPVGAVHV